MGIRAEVYNQRGSFFVATASTSPFCGMCSALCTLMLNNDVIILRSCYNHFVTANSTDVVEEVKRQLQQDYFGDTKD